VTPEMSNRDSRLTKPQKRPQFMTLFCQIIGILRSLKLTVICQIMTASWQVMTTICQLE